MHFLERGGQGRILRWRPWEKNLFLFKFESLNDRRWILNNGPWLFDKNLLILEEPVANRRITELEFKKEAFWIRLINLPIGFRNKIVAEKIGNNLGNFLEVDCDKDDQCWRNNMRLRVLLDIIEPLQRGFMLKLKEINRDCWITIRYERLPKLCFKCGRIGHVAKDYQDKMG